MRAAYLAYAVASLAVAASGSIGPSWSPGRFQGAANAFVTPLLLAALAEETPVESLGRSMGTFAAVQTAGVVSAPLCGGLAGALDYRLAFLVPAGVAVALALVPIPTTERPGEGDGARLRSAFTPRSGWVSGAAFLAYLAITGLGFLVALRAATPSGWAPRRGACCWRASAPRGWRPGARPARWWTGWGREGWSPRARWRARRSSRSWGWPGVRGCWRRCGWRWARARR